MSTETGQVQFSVEELPLWELEEDVATLVGLKLFSVLVQPLARSARVHQKQYGAQP